MKKVIFLFFPLLIIFLSCSESVNYLNLLFEDWEQVETQIAKYDLQENEIEFIEEYKKFVSDFELMNSSKEYGNYLSVYFDNTHNYFIEYADAVRIGIKNHDIKKIRMAENRFEIISKQQNSKASKYYLNIIILMGGLLLVIFLFLFFIVQKYEKELDNSVQAGIYTAFVMKEVEKERSRISKEIHDTVLQDLRYIQMETEYLNVKDGTDYQIKQKSNLNLLKQSIETLRNICQNLTPDELKNIEDDKTLLLAIEKLCRKFEEQNKIPCVFSFSKNLSLGNVDFQLSMNVFRIIQEALNNIIQHANATYVSVILKHEEIEGGKRNLSVIITDDGDGFEVNALRNAKHFGLSNMTARAKSIGAKLYIQSDKDAGTSIKLVL